MSDKKWIAKAVENKGGLHRSLGVPLGQKIPASKLEQAAHSKNPHIRKQANLAKNLKGLNAGGMPSLPDHPTPVGGAPIQPPAMRCPQPNCYFGGRKR